MQEIHISTREVQISMQEIRNGDNSNEYLLLIWNFSTNCGLCFTQKIANLWLLAASAYDGQSRW